MSKPDAYLLTYRETGHAGTIKCTTVASIDPEEERVDPDIRSSELISAVPLFRNPSEAVRQWQPIESCPLDTQVLLLVNGTLPDIGYRRSYGWSLRGCFEFTGTEGYYPTHWQPLPEIPEWYISTV